MTDDRYDGYYGNKTRALLLLAAALIGGMLMRGVSRNAFLTDAALGLLLPVAAAGLFSLLFFAMRPIWAPLLAAALFGLGFLFTPDAFMNASAVLGFLPAAAAAAYSIRKKLSFKASVLLCASAYTLALAALASADAWRLSGVLDASSVLGMADRWFDAVVSPMRTQAVAEAGLLATLDAYLRQLKEVFLAHWPSMFIALQLVKAFFTVLLGQYLYRRLNGMRMSFSGVREFAVSRPGAVFFGVSLLFGGMFYGTLTGRVLSNLFLLLLPAFLLHGGAVFWHLRENGPTRLRGLLLPMLLLLMLLMTPVGGAMALSLLGAADSFAELRRRF